MRQTTIWDFLPQESSTEAKPTNQRNTMKFESLEDLIEFLKQQTSITQSTEEHNSDECIDCQLAELESKESLLLANLISIEGYLADSASSEIDETYDNLLISATT